MDAKLVVVGGEAPQAEYTLTLPSIVGRSRTADIKIGHPLVSRKHCELYESDGQLAVRDLGSLNGTFVGQDRISEPVFLAPGATVTIGAVTFKAVYGDMEAAAAAAAAEEIPDFMSADNEPRASTVEQTIEMSGETPITEPAEAASGDDGSFDMSWLDDPSEDDASAQDAAPEAVAEEEPYAAVSQQEVDLELPLPDAEEQLVAENSADDGSDFAPPEEQPAASDDDGDDLNDFFASLK